MRLGGVSDPRNKSLMKMFNMINIGERAGSGVPNIFNVWESEGWVEPILEEQFEPDRMILSLEFSKKVTKKSDEKKVTKKTKQNYEILLQTMENGQWHRAIEFETVLDVKESRIKALLRQLAEQGLVETTGSTKGKMYRKVN